MINDAEREKFMSGDAIGGYKLACSNGDGYACKAYKVAVEDGFLETLTNVRLETSLINNGVADTRYGTRGVMATIRSELGIAYVDHFEALKASSFNPQWPSRYRIEKFHGEVFKQNGASDVFGGRISDTIIPRSLYDWCPNCQK